MAQHDYIIANQSGQAFRQDLNNALAAAVTNNSGASAPSTTYAYQYWADTGAGLLKIRNAANSAWITLRELDGRLTIEGGSAGAPSLYFIGDANTGIYSPGADQFAIATGGVQRLLVDASGAVQANGGTLDRINRAGNVLQVVNAECQVQATNTAVSWADTGLTATITPTSATSKILISAHQAGCVKMNANNGVSLRLLGGARHLVTFDINAGWTNSVSNNHIGGCSTSWLDSPATTSAVVYKTQFYNQTGTGTAYVQASGLGGNTTSTITLMEIAA
jgi:hypothetical protein